MKNKQKTIIIIGIVALLLLAFFVIALASSLKEKSADISEESSALVLEEEEIIEEAVSDYSAKWLFDNQIKGAVVAVSENEISKSSLQKLKSLGADFVFFEVYDYWGSDAIINNKVKKNLDEGLDFASQVGLKAIVVPVTGPGKQDGEFGVFTRNIFKEQWDDMLKDLVLETKDKPALIGWSIMGMPNPDIYFKEQNSDTFKSSSKIWNNLTIKYVETIRSIDLEKTVFVSPLNSGSIIGLSALEIIADENIGYLVNIWESEDYLFQNEDFEIKYSDEEFSKKDIERMIKAINDFKSRSNAPVIVSGYGGVRYIPDLDIYLGDLVSLLDTSKISHAYYAWGSNPRGDDFNLEFGENPYNDEVKESSALFKIILNSWNE